MSALSLALDALLNGRLPLVADLLVQGSKGLELAGEWKDWALPDQLELAAASDWFASLAELEAAGQQAILQHRKA